MASPFRLSKGLSELFDSHVQFIVISLNASPCCPGPSSAERLQGCLPVQSHQQVPDCLQGSPGLGKFLTLILSRLIFLPSPVPPRPYRASRDFCVFSRVSASRSSSPAQSNQLSNECLNGCCLQLSLTRMYAYFCFISL